MRANHRKQYEYHGLSEIAEQQVWANMKQRCYNPKCRSYINYGARGIKVCDQWRNSLAAFIRDMGPREKGMSIHRVDNDGNYEPSNCKWATPKEQAQNRRNRVILERNGEKILVSELGPLAWQRYRSGWSYEEIINGKKPPPSLARLKQRPRNIPEFCVKKREEGLLFRQIGDLLGLTHQRVQQIISSKINPC